MTRVEAMWSAAQHLAGSGFIVTMVVLAVVVLWWLDRTGS